MRRMLTCLVLAAAAAVSLTAPATAAERGWRAPIELTDSVYGGHNAHWYGAVVTTSQGETVATWLGGDLKRRVVVTDPTGAVTSSTTLDVGADYATLAADGLGNTYLAHSTAGSSSGSSAVFLVRPARGDFGAPENLPTSYVPRLLATPQGDVAAIWYGGAAIRPAGGTFESVPRLTVTGGWSAAFSEGGDLVVAGTSGRRLVTGIRTADGEWIQQELTDGVRAATATAVGIDDAGRAVVAWIEKKNPDYYGVDAAGMAQRPAGGEFGPPSALKRAGGVGWPNPGVVMSGGGRYTIAYPGTRGTRVVTGEAGGPPSYLRSWNFAGVEGGSGFVGSPSGEHALFTRGRQSPVGAIRTGGSAFELAQDVLTTCAAPTWMTTAVGDGGDASALMEVSGRLLLATDGPGEPQRKCYASSYDPLETYRYDPYRPTVTDFDAARSAGSWQPDTTPPPVTPLPPPFPAGRPSLAGSKGKLDRRARVVVVCGRRCIIKAKARIASHEGKELASASARTDSTGKPKLVVVPLKLSAAGVKALDEVLGDPQPKRLIWLTVSITISDPDGTKRTREVRTPLRLAG